MTDLIRAMEALDEAADALAKYVSELENESEKLGYPTIDDIEMRAAFAVGKRLKERPK